MIAVAAVPTAPSVFIATTVTEYPPPDGRPRKRTERAAGETVLRATTPPGAIAVTRYAANSPPPSESGETQ
jgi:hypothetical protein